MGRNLRRIPGPINGKQSPNQVNQPEPQDDEFDIQLNWCLTNLKAILRQEGDAGKNLSEKKLAETNHVYSQLIDPKTLFIKKRQLMSTYFGDYRTKMKKESEKFKSKSEQLKINNCLETKLPKKPVVCKRREKKVNPVPSEPFKFNFPIEQ